MHTKAFKLINANTGEDGGTREIEVSRDFACIESAHAKICRIAFCKKRYSVTSDAEGGG